MSDAEDGSGDVLPPSPATGPSQPALGSPSRVSRNTGGPSTSAGRTPTGSPSASQRTLARFIFGHRRTSTNTLERNRLTTMSVTSIPENPPLPVLNIQDEDSNERGERPESPAVEVIGGEEPGQRSPDVISIVDDSNSSSGSVEEEREISQPASPVPDHIPPEAMNDVAQPPADPSRENRLAAEPSVATPAGAVRTLIEDGESPADFRSPKRRRIVSPLKGTTSAEGKEDTKEDEVEDDSNCCPICFEDWTTSGSHRLTSLRCGHLFGQSCIEKWLKGQGGKCPHCNAKAKRQDIRVLYAKSIKAIDTTERDRALQDLEKEREAKRRVELEAAQTRLQYQLAVDERNRLRTEVDRLKQQISAQRSNVSNVAPTQMLIGDDGNCDGQFLLDKTIKIWESGNCRVMAYSPSLGTLVVSQPSTSPLFPGFGIKKISTMDFKTAQYLTIHSKPIRDVAFHPCVDDGILLSCGLDKMVKMTSIISNAIVQTYEAQNPVWSCVWNADDRNIFYAGQTSGTVLEYDIRNTSEHVQELNKEGSRSPVVSLQYIPKDLQAPFRQGGLLVGQLNGISFYERKTDNQHRLHMLPLEGNLTSLCFEPNTRHLLVSFRPTAKHPTSRHQLCEMMTTNLSMDPTVIDNSCTCHVVQTFNGSQRQTVLSRSLLLPHPANKTRMFVCAGQEPSSGIAIWDSGSGHLRQSMSAGGIVVDICAIHANHNTFIATLTEKQLKVFKWKDNVL